jgi:probable HAF family extracellular repeat protein
MRRSALLAVSALGLLAACDDPTRPTHRVPGINPEVVTGAPIQELGTLGGAESRAYAINNAGQVAGYSLNASGMEIAFRWTDGGGMENLGTVAGGFASYGFAINAGGDVAGAVGTAAGEIHAALWTSGSGWTDIGLVPGKAMSFAYGVNASRTVVGYGVNLDPVTFDFTDYQAFRWTPTGGLVQLAALAGGSQSQALGINDAGVAVGRATDASGVWHAVKWNADGSVVDLGVPSGRIGSYGSAINNDGVVVGYSEHTTGWGSAFVVDMNGVMTDLGRAGTVVSVPQAVNSMGEGTGYSTSAGYVLRAFIWTLDQGFVELESLPGGGNTMGQGINDNARVAGIATNGAGQMRAVVWNVTLGPNTPPVADFSFFPGISEGDNVLLDGRASNDPDGSPLVSYEWDFGDGTTGTGPTAYHTWVDEGSYQVTLKVTDFAGTSHSITRTANVSNIAPTVSAGAEYMVPPGSRFHVRVPFADRGASDGPWSYTITWGDGTTTSGTMANQSTPIAGNKLYRNEGTYAMSVRVTDVDGASTTRSFTLVVRPDPVSNSSQADILPGVSPNNISRSAPTPALTPVALKSSSRVNAALIDPASVWFGSATTGWIRPVLDPATCGGPCTSVVDVNADGRLDLVVNVDTRVLAGGVGSYTAIIWGQLTSDGSYVKFGDSFTFAP